MWTWAAAWETAGLFFSFSSVFPAHFTSGCTRQPHCRAKSPQIYSAYPIFSNFGFVLRILFKFLTNCKMFWPRSSEITNISMQKLIKINILIVISPALHAEFVQTKQTYPRIRISNMCIMCKMYETKFEIPKIRSW